MSAFYEGLSHLPSSYDFSSGALPAATIFAPGGAGRLCPLKPEVQHQYRQDQERSDDDQQHVGLDVHEAEAVVQVPMMKTARIGPPILPEPPEVLTPPRTTIAITESS